PPPPRSSLVFSSSAHHSAPPATSTLSLHDALPISDQPVSQGPPSFGSAVSVFRSPEPSFLHHRWLRMIRCRRLLRSAGKDHVFGDRKSTRLNSSHVKISYAVFCLKRKRKEKRLGAG